MSTHKTANFTGMLALTVLTALLLLASPAGAQSTRELAMTFGSFGEPTGIAVDLETGNVYVADKLDQTVDIFNASGGQATGLPSQIAGLLFPGEGQVDHANELPAGVAVDNSCYEHEPRLTGRACEEYDPSYGDLYITSGEHGVQKFRLNAADKYEMVAEMFLGGEARSVAVDARGNVYVGMEYPTIFEFKKMVEKIVSGGKEEFEEKLERISLSQSTVAEVDYLAADDLGDLYAGSRHEFEGQSVPPRGPVELKLGASGNLLSEEVFAGRVEGAHRIVAVNRSTGNVYVGDGPEIAEYDSAGVLQLKFGSTEPLGGSLGRGVAIVTASGIAVNPGLDRIYVSNPLHDDVDVFGPAVGLAVIPEVQPMASTISRTSALISGAADPEAGQAASFYFEYVKEAEYEPSGTDPYRAGGRTAVGVLPGGHAVQSTGQVVLTGLLPGTTYHYRLVVNNATGTSEGPDETFTTAPATPPAVITGPASEVGPTSATLMGTVAPRGLPTSYVFEVGTDTSYGGARLFGNAGNSTGEVSVLVALRYLVPDTVYHYRLVATSFDGTSYGQDGTFTTPGVPSSILQPPSAALIPSPAAQFPSIAGAITEPVGTRAKARKQKRKQKARRKTGKRRAVRRPARRH
jgi:DNA-binding beta-propeller fold protein YncE